SIVTYAVNFFGFFGDIGFGAALVQRKDKPTEKMLRTAFTIQQGLMTALVAIVFFVAPFLSGKYGLSDSSAWLFRAFSLSLFLTSLKVVPAILLERRLDFNRLVIPEIAEVFAYQGVAVTMAYLGYGVWSLVCATLARGVLGFAILFILAPWKFGFAVDKSIVRELVTFGAPFQLGQFFWLIKNAATPVFAGWFCGKAAVGYLTWSWGLALMPYTIVEIVNRVVFPVCSRLQHDRQMLAVSIEKYVRMTALGVFPIAMVMMAVAPYAIKHVYSAKWTPALPSLYLFLISMMGAPVINIFSRAFYGIGKINTAVKLTAVYVLLGWALNVPLVLSYGFVGIAWSALLVNVVCIWLPMHEMNKIVRIRVFRQIWAPLLSACVAMLVTGWIARMAISGVITLVAVTLLGFIIYFATMFLIERGVLLSEIESFISTLKGSPDEGA
ncbi:MAG: oligosaccharide flippase family protein, partial [Armatimonadota bacterium]|nr:oligosaccharide flippase family protein [Armatimonadota bacterium]